jgi:diadenylate cyclase
MNLGAIVTNFRIQDVLDILFLTVLAYYLFLWFRGTKAFNALVGLIALGIVFTLAQTWGLFMTTWVFQIFWQVLVILLIILFQSEIRQVLEKVDPLQAFGFKKKIKPGEWVQGFSEGIFTLAERKIGALVILERQDRVGQWITGGQELETQAGREILLSVFQKDSPLHDGAAVIRNGRLTLVACYLPLSSDENLPKSWGTRHRAAVGLSEKCDAIVIVASEEKGAVTFVFQKKATVLDSPDQLSMLVQETLQPVSPPRLGWKKRGLSLLLHRWKAKGGTLALVLALWLMLAGQQNFEVALTLSLETRNVPGEMEVVEPLDPQVRVRIRGLRKDSGTLTERNVRAVVDLAAAAAGRRTFLITREEILLPNERVSIVSIEPSQITFGLQKKTITRE